MKVLRGETGPRSANFWVGVVVIAGLGIYAGIAGGHWSWVLFAWGAITGPAQITWGHVQTIAITMRLYPPSAERDAAIDTFRRQGWKKYRWAYAFWIAFGVAVGAVAARKGIYFDVLLTVFTVVKLLLPLAQLRAAAPRDRE